MDKDIITGNSYCAWFEHCMENLCKFKVLNGESGDNNGSNIASDVVIHSVLYPSLMQSPMVVIPIMYIFGYCHQFLLVVMKLIQEKSV